MFLPNQAIDLNTLSDDDFDTHIDTLTPTEAIEAISQRRGVEDADQYAHWRKAVLNKQRDAAQRKLNAKHKPFDPSRYNSYPEMKRAEALYNQQISQQHDEARATIDALDKQIADINQYQNRRNAQIAAERETENPLRNTQQEATQPTIQPSSQPSDTTPIPQYSQDTATDRPTTTTPTDTGTTRQDVVRHEYDKVSEELFKFTHDYLTNKLGYNFQSEEDFYYWATKKSEKQLAKWLQEKAGLDTKQTLEVIQLLRKYSELRKQLLSNPNTTHQDVVNNHQDVVEPHQSGEITEMVQPVGQNILGNLFNQFRGKAQEAINFLLNRGEGNAIAALNHPQVGDIDLWYGNDKAGLKKIAQKHPEVLDDLQGIINNMHVVKASDNRIVLESDTHRAIVSKMLGNEKTDNWLLSAYELKSTSAGSSDIDTEPIGMQNGTAALHSTPSDNKDTTSSLNNNNLQQKIAQAEAEVNTNPTEAQKEAGNYKKGHIRLGAFDITIEQPQGSIRRGVDANGKAWESKMHNTYGYIRGTEGVDGDHIDVFLANDMDSWNGEQVFVIDQYNEDGTFDEHKVMLGFNDIDQAYQAYLSNYEKGWEKKHNIVTTATTTDDFNKWIDSSHRKTKPFADYKSVKTTAGQATPAESTTDRRDTTLASPEPSQAHDTKERQAKLAHIDTWKRSINAPIVVLSDIHEVNNPQARAAIASATLSAQRFPGWFSDGTIYLYLPHCTDTTDIDRTILHECIAHYGVRKLFPSPHSLNRFYDQVWNMMQHNDRQRFLQYPGISNLTGNNARRAAADEYIAHLAEQLHTQGTTITPEQTSIWQRIVSFLRNALRQAGINLRLSDTDLNNLLISSYNNLRNNTSHPSHSTSHTTTMTHPLPSERRVEGYSPSMNNPQQATGEVGGNTTLNQQPSEKTGNTTNTTPIQPLSPSTSDTELDIFLRENRAANDRHREQWKSIPRPRDLEKAYNAGDTQAIEQWKAGWEAFLQQLIPMDLPVIDGTITTASRNKAVKMVQTSHGYKVDKESSAYKAFDYIEKSLKKRKKQLERNLTEEERRTIDIVKRGLRGELNNTRMRAKKKTAPETESVLDEHQPSVVSSADGAKVLKNLDNTINEYDKNANKRPNTIIGDIAKALGAKKHGSNSQYATFEAVNGKVFTIRLANHNAKVSTFDNHNESEGISIVISPATNTGTINDGDAHVVEYFYDAIKLRKANGKPLVQILKSIKQSLYSGEYHDTTGLAEREEVNAPDTRFRFIGVRGATNLDLAEEATTRLDNLAIARSMEQEGRDERTIKLATGWERGADNLWRYEMPDDFTFKTEQIEGEYILLKDFIDAPSLFTEYPQLRDIKVKFDNLTDYGGYWSISDKTIAIDNSNKSKEEIKSVLVHEIQHAVQDIEGFAEGASPEEYQEHDYSSAILHDMYTIRRSAEELVKDGKYKYLRSAVKNIVNLYSQKQWFRPETIERFDIYKDKNYIDDLIDYITHYNASELDDASINDYRQAFDKYMRTAGEVEAPNVANRLNYTPEERANTLARITEDVAREDQIFISQALGNPAMGSRGSKVQDITLPEIGDNGLTMHSVEITPDMRESVMQGQTMFRSISPSASTSEIELHPKSWTKKRRKK